MLGGRDAGGAQGAAEQIEAAITARRAARGDEIVSNLIFLLAAGVETTERVLTSTLRHLVQNPAEWDWLRANYKDSEKLSAFCAEALRYFPPLTILVREAMQDTKLGDQAVKAGDPLVSVEAMKMETQIRAEQDGVVKAAHVRPGDTVAARDLLVEMRS